MVFTFADKTKFNALDVALPEMSITPYGQYKVGTNKDFTNNFNAHAQRDTKKWRAKWCECFIRL